MSYLVVVATNITIFAVLTVSLNMVVGYAGQPNLGQGAFFGIGGYMAAVLGTSYGWSFWTTLPVAFACGGVSGALLGAISLRLRDDFLAITTIGVNFVVVAMFQTVPFFGGSTGVYAIPLPTLSGRAFTNEVFLVVSLVLLGLAVLASYGIDRSWLGGALHAIKDDELAAATVGVPVAGYKLAVFALSTALAGVAGAVYAYFLSAVTPTSFGFSQSITVLAMLMLGGVGTIRGAVLGAVLLGALPEVFRFVSNYRLLTFGLILLLTLRFQPQGLLGRDSLIPRSFRRLAAGRWARRPIDGPLGGEPA